MLLCLLTLTSSLLAATAEIELAHPHIDFHNQEKIANGAKLFAQNCLSCHSMKALIHDPLSIEAGITADNQPTWDAEAWGGHPPPDLSLIGKSQSVDWIYTFLRSYYADHSRPTGSNNLVLKNTNMPNPFAALAGEQKLVREPRSDKKWFEILEVSHSGKVSPQEFHDIVLDIVNYLHYAAEPTKAERESIGFWVLAYFILLWLVLLAIHRCYWKSIKEK